MTDDEKRMKAILNLLEERGLPENVYHEIKHHLELDRDPEDWPDGYSRLDAFSDFLYAMECHFADGIASIEEKRFRKLLRDAEIDLGYVIDREEMDRRFTGWVQKPVYRHRKKYWYTVW